jgi:hypothetical protein
MTHTREVLESLGGLPYEGPTAFHHEFWHAVWCGLGDFGRDHGYIWDDHAAYRKVVPILEKEAGHPLDIETKGWFTKQAYGANPRYKVGIWELPGYDATIRKLVLDDISAHPLWYAHVLYKRAERILTETTPISIAYGDEREDYPAEWVSVACAPLLLVLLLMRRFFSTKLLLFATPLSIPAFLIYSGAGVTNYSCFHLIGVSIVVMGVLRWFVHRLRVRVG